MSHKFDRTLRINQKVVEILEDPVTIHYLSRKLIRRKPKYLPRLLWKLLLLIVLAPATRSGKDQCLKPRSIGEKDFTRIVSPELAQNIVYRLRQGEIVEFLNRYELDEVKASSADAGATNIILGVRSSGRTRWGLGELKTR
jgi:hypothetical protein